MKNPFFKSESELIYFPIQVLGQQSDKIIFLQFFSFENKHKLQTYFISEENGQHSK
jgi:hypothetical protein